MSGKANNILLRNTLLLQGDVVGSTHNLCSTRVRNSATREMWFSFPVLSITRRST